MVRVAMCPGEGRGGQGGHVPPQLAGVSFPLYSAHAALSCIPGTLYAWTTVSLDHYIPGNLYPSIPVFLYPCIPVTLYPSFDKRIILLFCSLVLSSSVFSTAFTTLDTCSIATSESRKGYYFRISKELLRNN